jgi:phosphate transport system permease protein
MRGFFRRLTNTAFTTTAGLSVLLMAAALVIILGPILWQGASAVVFRGTVEYRKMQLNRFGRGNSRAVEEEMRRVEAARQSVYDILDRFARGIDVEPLADRAKGICRDLRDQLWNRVAEGRLAKDESRRLRRESRRLRDLLLAAFASTDGDEALRKLSQVAGAPSRAELAGTVAEELFGLAEQYARTVRTVDLGRRKKYAEKLGTVTELLRKLLGPRSGEKTLGLAQFTYGATRWDQAQRILHDLTYEEQYVPAGEGKPLKKTLVPRAKLFEGTELAKIFPMIETHLEEMLHPRWTFYWQYFIDDSPPGQFVGGIGPEILGTVLLTALAMVFAVPVGIITAAYLVECTRDNLFIRTIRTCINTLAGVPSIVFGLFGLAFFVMWFQGDLLGVKGHKSILAGSLTLAVLVLPIVIRATEEAIRAVPPSYREASLALGAGKFRTFVTVTLPAALPGVLTGVILSMSRAAGETAPILFTAAVAVGPVARSILEPTRALSYSSFVYATSDTVAMEAPHNQYGMIMSLVLIVLALNTTAILLRSRMSKKLRGG